MCLNRKGNSQISQITVAHQAGHEAWRSMLRTITFRVKKKKPPCEIAIFHLPPTTTDNTPVYSFFFTIPSLFSSFIAKGTSFVSFFLRLSRPSYYSKSQYTVNGNECFVVTSLVTNINGFRWTSSVKEVVCLVGYWFNPNVHIIISQGKRWCCLIDMRFYDCE